MSGSARVSTEHLVLGRYRLLERLGAGGFGEVWRAEDAQLTRQVALKRIHAGVDGSEQRFLREAQAAARVAHPAIVALYEAFSEAGDCYLISELIEGATLAELMAEEALGDEEIVEIGLALCDAISHAHARGVIHRDVKPQNILVPDDPPEGTVAAKLTDFGGATLEGEEALTSAGDILGTLAYMAPEQSDGQPARPESDLYSLALVLYEALSGDNPVRAGTPAATVRRIGSRLPPLRRLRADLPLPLTAAIDACLLPAPEDRGQISDLASALDAALCELTDAAHGEERSDASTVRHGTAILRLRPGRGRKQPQTALTVAHAGVGTRTVLEPRPRKRLPASEPQRRDGGGVQELARTAEPDALDPGAPEHVRRSAAGPLALPRAGWALLAAAGVIWQTAAGRPGLALLLAAATVPLLVLMPARASPLWLSGALAPALGVVGLAAAFPGLAGRPSSLRMRLTLGGIGFWWLAIGELVYGRELPPGPVLGGVAGAAAKAGRGATDPLLWERSLSSSAHALGPLLSAPVFLAAALWAVGAVAMPWLVRRRSIALALALALALSAVLTVGPALLAGALRGSGPVGLSETAGSAVVILAAVLGALIAVGTRRLSNPP